MDQSFVKNCSCVYFARDNTTQGQIGSHDCVLSNLMFYTEGSIEFAFLEGDEEPHIPLTVSPPFEMNETARIPKQGQSHSTGVSLSFPSLRKKAKRIDPDVSDYVESIQEAHEKRRRGMSGTRRVWCSEEDVKLRELVVKYNQRHWRQVARGSSSDGFSRVELGTHRSETECRQHYCRVLLRTSAVAK